MPRVLLFLASIGLTIFALADCVTTEESRCRGLPKLVWVLLIVFVPWIGPIVWLLIGKDRKQPCATGLNAEFQTYFSPSSRAARRDKKHRNRPLAPDEDPEFLAELDKKIREERRSKYQKPAAKDSAGKDSGAKEADTKETDSKNSGAKEVDTENPGANNPGTNNSELNPENPGSNPSNPKFELNNPEPTKQNPDHPNNDDPESKSDSDN